MKPVMMFYIFSLFISLFLLGCGDGFKSIQNLSKGLSVEPPVTVPPPTTPSEPITLGGKAVDLSQPVNQTFLDDVKALGVSTIIRYYDHTNETIRGKTLRRAERDLIVRNGLKIAVVFQHNNDELASFTVARGTMDAERSLVLAAENLQPQDTAIYFGIDGGWSTAADLDRIRQYVSTASIRIRAAGFRMGVYGSGRVCRMVLSEDLADHCWLANARGWPDYDLFFQSSQWVLRQYLPERVGSFEVDFNDINPEVSDFGQF